MEYVSSLHNAVACLISPSGAIWPEGSGGDGGTAPAGWIAAGVAAVGAVAGAAAGSEAAGEEAGGTGGAATGCGAAPSEAFNAEPQLPQNLNPGGASVPQLGHRTSNLEPHWPQNFICSGLSN